MKVMALDLGDVWTGVALSDKLKMLAKPHTTVKTAQLFEFLHEIFKQEPIETLVIGYPKTMKGGQSLQTQKVLDQKNEIEQQFPDLKIILVDERLSSKAARDIQGKKARTQPHQEHAIAAAVILQAYLQFRS